MPRLPNLIIIGAEKCGTSSLHYYLNLHPDISMSRKKELWFFNDTHNWHLGVDWYASQFNENSIIAGESSPGYTLYPRKMGVPEKIHSLIPDVKLIYIVRDPIERIKSSYMMKYASGRENRSIQEALVNLDNNYLIIPSLYFMQIEQYLQFFDTSQLLVTTLENLQKNTQVTMQNIFKFLNVTPDFQTDNFNKIINSSTNRRRNKYIRKIFRFFSSSKSIEIFPEEIRRRIGNLVYFPFSKKIVRPIIDQKLKERLISFFENDVRQLRNFTNLDLEDWSL